MVCASGLGVKNMFGNVFREHEGYGLESKRQRAVGFAIMLFDPKNSTQLTNGTKGWVTYQGPSALHIYPLTRKIIQFEAVVLSFMR